jgi:hypothetical protein
MADPKVSTALSAAGELQAQLLVLHVFERDTVPFGFVAKVDAMYGGAISRILASGDFAGRHDDVLMIYPPAPDCGIRRVR